MQDFTLDERLARDCLALGRMDDLLVLLMDNSLVPWLVLVPRTSARELYELPAEQGAGLWRAVQSLSRFLTETCQPDKLNVAAIGNVVEQLHVHLVARRWDDFCWPGVVWGRPERAPYTPAQVVSMAASLRQHLGGAFRPMAAEG